MQGHTLSSNVIYRGSSSSKAHESSMSPTGEKIGGIVGGLAAAVASAINVLEGTTRDRGEANAGSW